MNKLNNSTQCERVKLMRLICCVSGETARSCTRKTLCTDNEIDFSSRSPIRHCDQVYSHMGNRWRTHCIRHTMQQPLGAYMQLVRSSPLKSRSAHSFARAAYVRLSADCIRCIEHSLKSFFLCGEWHECWVCARERERTSIQSTQFLPFQFSFYSFLCLIFFRYSCLLFGVQLVVASTKRTRFPHSARLYSLSTLLFSFFSLCQF